MAGLPPSCWRDRARLSGQKLPTCSPGCGAACPASAIVFGDVNNPESEVARPSRHNRGFHVLEELGTKPAITYLAALKNPSGEGEP